MCSNLTQEFFDLVVKSSNFMSRQNRVSTGLPPRMGNLGRVTAMTSNPKLRLSQSGLLFCTGVETILPHKFFAGTPQSTDFCFSNIKMSFISSDSEMTFASEDSEIYYIAEEMKDEDQANISLFASLLLTTQPPSLRPTTNEQPNTRRWMLAKNSNEHWRTDQKAKSNTWLKRVTRVHYFAPSSILAA